MPMERRGLVGRVLFRGLGLGVFGGRGIVGRWGGDEMVYLQCGDFARFFGIVGFGLMVGNGRLLGGC